MKLSVPAPRAVISSIGGVLFDYKRVTDFPEEHKIYFRIDARDQYDRKIDLETVYFWMGQSDESRKEVMPHFGADERSPGYDGMINLKPALVKITEFCKKNNVEKLWCYGATFDHVILMDAYKQLRVKFPVSYRDLLDMRTFVYIMPKAERPNVGTKHNALDDAINQAIWMQKIYQEYNANLQP